MLVHKAFKFRIYPTQQQIELIHKTIGCSRFVFNFFLAEQQKQDKYWKLCEEFVQQGILPSNEWKSSFFNKYDTIKQLPELKKHYPFLKEVDSISLQKSVEVLADSFSRFYKKQNKPPKFKSKKNPVQSYTTKFTNGNIEVLDKHIKLPKLGLVRFSKSREVIGRIMNATIRKSASDKYYISIMCETEVEALRKTSSSVGIDLGLKEFAILSDGNTYENPRFLHRLEDKLIKAQRTLSRRKIGSSNWRKQRIKVARLHEKITNARQDFLHKASTAIVKNHDIIGIEDLQVSQMLKKETHAKAISEVSWSTFRTMLEYKANWYGKLVIAVSKQYPSSQLCSSCGYQHKAVKQLNLRTWSCPECKTTHDRDRNASINIKRESQRLIAVGTTV